MLHIIDNCKSQHRLVCMEQKLRQFPSKSWENNPLTKFINTLSSITKLFRQKWFRGRKIHTDWDIRVEQCQFSDLAITGLITDYSSFQSFYVIWLSANTEEGISVGLVTLKNGQRSVESVEKYYQINCFRLIIFLVCSSLTFC